MAKSIFKSGGRSMQLIQKIAFVITFIFLTTTVCGQSTVSLDDMAHQGLANLFARYNDQGIPEAISVFPVVEYEGTEQGMWICAVRFDVLIDRRISPEYTYKSVGIGSTENEAKAGAVREWLAAFGVPFCRATLKTGDGHQIGDLFAYSGLLGIRGERPDSWIDSPMAENGPAMILSSLLRVQKVRQLTPPFTLDLRIVISPYGGIESGECRLNGRVESALLAALENLPWPTGQAPYMVKQYFVIEENDEQQ
jgi:hypothetical protein